MALSDLWQIVNLPGYEQLRDKPFMPAIPKRLIGVTDMFAAIREGDIRAAPSVRVVRSGRAVSAAGRRRRKGAGDQSDALPHVGKELADHARAARGRRKRETSRGRHRAQGAVRRREQHRVGQAPGARRRPRRLRLRQSEGARQVAAGRARRRRRHAALHALRHRELQRENGAPLYRLEPVHVPARARRRRRAAVQRADRILEDHRLRRPVGRAGDAAARADLR